MAATGQKGLYVNMNTGAVQAYLPPFRNALINGDMRINQRGTSTNLASLTAVATTTPGSWVVDRWNVFRGSFAAGASIGQGTGMVYTDLPFSDAGITTHARVGRTAANAATTAIYCDYNMESQDSYRLVGKVVTLSFYYRTGTNFSDNSLAASLHSGTATDQPLRNGTTFTSFAITTFAKSSSWVRATVTGTVPTSATQVCLRFSYTPVGTAGNADHFDLTGVQLELGNVATPFEVRPFPVELQTCQRYFEVLYMRVSVYITLNEYSITPYTFKVEKRTSNITFSPSYLYVPNALNGAYLETFTTYGCALVIGAKTSASGSVYLNAQGPFYISAEI
jgi:hypothetical protein